MHSRDPWGSQRLGCSPASKKDMKILKLRRKGQQPSGAVESSLKAASLFDSTGHTVPAFRKSTGQHCCLLPGPCLGCFTLLQHRWFTFREEPDVAGHGATLARPALDENVVNEKQMSTLEQWQWQRLGNRSFVE
ncbi:hypothetical protein AOLI_G00088790 [Acnodon oligacanthus]